MAANHKVFGAMKNPKIQRGGFRIGSLRKQTLCSKNTITVDMHNEIKEAARRVLSRRP